MAEMRRKKRRSSNDFLWVLIILLIICLGVLGRQEYKIYQINKEMSATQQRVDELKKVQAELEAERKRLDDLKYIEKLAREKVQTAESQIAVARDGNIYIEPVTKDILNRM